MSQRARPALPATWRWVALQELGDWSGGGTPSKADAAFWRGGNIPWVSPKDMKADIIRDTEDHIADVALEGSSVKLLPRGTVLVVTRSGILQHTLPLAVTDVPVTVNQDLKALSPHAGVHPRFIAGALKAVEDDVLLQCSKDGTTVHSIDTAKLLAYEVPISPSAEQHRIVDAVDSYLSRVDEAVDLLERAREKLKRYRAAVLKTAVEGRLVPTEAELARAEGRDYEPANVLLKRILAERRRRWEEVERARMEVMGRPPKDEGWKERYREPRAADQNDLPRIPDGWCWATLEQLSWVASYGTSLRCDREPSGVPVVRIPNVSEGSLDLSDMKFCQSLSLSGHEALAPGDLLVIRTNGSRSLLARAALVTDTLVPPHFFASYLIRFRLALPEIGRWVSAYWDAPQTRTRLESEAATSAGQYNVSLAALSKQPIPLPPLLEQIRIGGEISLLESIARQNTVAVSMALQRCDRLRQAVLQWAFEGKLVDQDPADEPAAVLLERIRTETAAATSRAPGGPGWRKASRRQG